MSNSFIGCLFLVALSSLCFTTNGKEKHSDPGGEAVGLANAFVPFISLFIQNNREVGIGEYYGQKIPLTSGPSSLRLFISLSQI